MVIKAYTVTLESDVVEKIKIKLNNEKLSPFINDLLKRELEEEKQDDNA